eukprot:14078134-Alexandrium_andersonii.AAC.1
MPATSSTVSTLKGCASSTMPIPRISQSPRGRLKQSPLHAVPAGGFSLRTMLRIGRARAILGSL